MMDFLCTSLNRFTCCSFFESNAHTHTEPVQLWKGKLVSLRDQPGRSWLGGDPCSWARTTAPVFACILEIGQSGGAYTVDARNFFLVTKEGMPFGCCHMLCFERRTCRFQMLYGLWTPKLRWTVEFSSRRTCWTSRSISKSMAFLWHPLHLWHHWRILEVNGYTEGSEILEQLGRAELLKAWLRRLGAGDWEMLCLNLWRFHDYFLRKRMV